LIHYMSDFYKHAASSVTDTIATITANPRLRAVLAYNFGDYGTVPRDAPFIMHAILQNHFLKGVSYPTGGSSQIAFSIIPTILSAGGAVLVRADVESIVIENNAAVGVKLRRDGNIVRAPTVISDAGLMNTVHRLLPSNVRPQFDHMLRHVRPGTGGMSVYVGLRGTAEELGLNGKHYWAVWDDASGPQACSQTDLDAIVQKFLNWDASDISASKPNVPMLFISFPSAKDPLWPQRHPNKSSATIVTFANYNWFRKWEDGRVMHRGDDYDAFKKTLGDMVWEQTLSLFPQLRDKVRVANIKL
jgi:all-trans-retinol 13,14-reductase